MLMMTMMMMTWLGTLMCMGIINSVVCVCVVGIVAIVFLFRNICMWPQPLPIGLGVLASFNITVCYSCNYPIAQALGGRA